MSTPRAADLAQSAYTFRCGCTPAHGVICTIHCQWQGCTRDQHTAACIAGERVGNGEVSR